MSLIGALGVSVLLGVHLATTAIVAWRMRDVPKAVVSGTPFVTLLRPVLGLDPFDIETLESSFHLDWPAYDVIFCAAREADPACAVINEMIGRHPHVSARLLIGDDRITSNPKLNNLAKGFAAASGEFVVMADANLLLPADYFQRLFAVWDEDAALISSPPAGVRPGNLWGAVECAFLNGLQGRWQLAADSFGLGYAQGKTLAVRKAWLEAAGGLAALGRNLAEDVAFTRLVRDRGAKVRLARNLFSQPIGSRPLRAVWDRQLRWSLVRREGFPALYAFEILLGFLPPALILASFASPIWLLALAALWYGAEWALCRLAGWPSALRDVVAMVLRDLLLPALWLFSFTRRQFEWRGNRMGIAHDPA